MQRLRNCALEVIDSHNGVRKSNERSGCPNEQISVQYGRRSYDIVGIGLWPERHLKNLHVAVALQKFCLKEPVHQYSSQQYN